MNTSIKDRLTLLLDPAQKSLNGVDFVEVSSNQTELTVHFLNSVTVKGAPLSATVSGGETVSSVPLKPIQDSDWGSEAGNGAVTRPVLKLHAEYPGDFSIYTLTLISPNLDPFFSRAAFSFKANCPTDLDCAAPAAECPPVDAQNPPIDYLAKDFLSFRKALLDYSALRYPQWQEQSEADFGMMFMEALCALADDFSYTQDRIAGEASLPTASQRRSIVRHARLVDYHPMPAIAATVILRFEVQAPAKNQGNSYQIPNGILVSAKNALGESIYFETGLELVDTVNNQLKMESYPANFLWNANPGIQAYWWDDSQRCLRAGSTELWVRQPVQNGQQQSLGLILQQQLLLESKAANSADPPIREIVNVFGFEESADPLFDMNGQPLAGQPASVPALKVTRIFLALPTQFDHDLTTASLSGNLVPASQGRRIVNEAFVIPPAPAGGGQSAATGLAIVRDGPNSQPGSPVPSYLYTLNAGPLTWLRTSSQGFPRPELFLIGDKDKAPWIWRNSLLDAERFENSFTLDPMTYARIRREFNSVDISDYTSDDGFTIRFGDNNFGGMPVAGELFQATYRIGGGIAGNLMADSITTMEPGVPPWIVAVTNPLPASGGADQESNEQVRRLAPQAFRAKTFRAVRPEDYAAAARLLPWVLQAGCTCRWTGSWLTLFTSADPQGSETITLAQQSELIALLNRYRMAGYESFAPPPLYLALDLFIVVCAQPWAFAADVKAALLRALSNRKFAGGGSGFFYTDRFTFGAGLERSQLEAAIQNVDGVMGVNSITYRRHGLTPTPLNMEDNVTVAVNQIIRVDNDPSRPERGSLQITVEGGK